MSRACVKVGTPASAASPATWRYSSGSVAGAYPTSTPMPSAPSARSADSRASMAVICWGVAGRCQASLARLARNVASLPSRADPGDGLHPGQRPGRGEAVVDGPALGRRAPVRGLHRGDACFQLKRGGDAIQGLQRKAGDVVHVTVQIDEPGRDHEACDVEVRLGAGQGVTDLGDLAAGDRDILHGIQAGFGIDHAPAAQHDVRPAHRAPPQSGQRGHTFGRDLARRPGESAYGEGFTTSALPPPRRTGSAMASERPRPRIASAVASPG